MKPVAVELRAVSKRFGKVVAVDDVSLKAEPGEFLTLLGPSGCGKTTLLRLIAGFETPDTGSVWLDGREITRLPPQARDVNQVFQSYALFPHLSVRENVAFGLKLQRLPRAEIDARVQEALELVALRDCDDRRPHELSGGQRQRVGLARAIAPRPAVLLLDEPLSALDARLRQSTQMELKRLQRRLGTTFIFVTHDQDEALTMSDRIALIHAGRVEQIGSVDEVYHQPATSFAATFLGHANVLLAELASHSGMVAEVKVANAFTLQLNGRSWAANRPRAQLSIRPEKVQLLPVFGQGGGAILARVEEVEFRGATRRYVVSLPNGTKLVAVALNARGLPAFEVGHEISVLISGEDVVVLGDRA